MERNIKIKNIDTKPDTEADVKNYAQPCSESNMNVEKFNLQVLKDSILTIKWYMDNCTTEPNKHESFYNIGMTQITEIEYLIKQIKL